jgi:phosphate transport system substrate-binding protein
MKKMKLLFLCGILLILFNSCSQKPVGVNFISIKGSDTMLLLVENLAEEFMRENENISIYVEGGGSRQGIKALYQEHVDISASSRPLETAEIQSLAERFSTLGVSNAIAKDALSIYIHPDNPLENLTIDQLRDIFEGKITNWEKINGINAPINIYVRNPNSGTNLYFREHILNGNNYDTSAVALSTTKMLISKIMEDEYGIGYGGIGYDNDGQGVLNINGYFPSAKNVRDNNYPISRYLYFYTLDSPKGHVKEFMDWVVSKKGQAVVERSGFIPIVNISY